MSTAPTKKNIKSRNEAQEYIDISEKVRSGEYFREARSGYDLVAHDPMAERYFYVVITFLSFVTLLFSLKAMQDYYPLNTSVPIIIAGNDNGDDVVSMRALVRSKEDNASEMLLRYFVKNFVKAWEEYKITTFDRDSGTIKSQSNESLMQKYMEFIDPRNAESPITLYQRHSKRKITIVSLRTMGVGEMEVVFEAEVESRTEIKKTRWLSNISFQYTGLEIDQDTGNPLPVGFTVTQYHSKRLQDIK
jgi:type IV secretory pathway component VirB8